jgi:pyrimidine deaminase RibD-like protein
MGFDRYPKLDGKALFVALFQENHTARRRFRITTTAGDAIEGIPTTDIRSVDDADSFLVRGDGDAHYRIPFSDLAAAEPIAVPNDRYFMSIAIEESRNCVPEEGKPRPLVGAVLVQEGAIVAKAFRGELKSGDHAEYTLLERRLKGRSVAGSVLYTTLEPCIKRGERKVPCVEHITGRRINRVVIGMLDPNQEIRGEGVWRLREHGVHVALCDSEQMAQIEEISRQFVRHFRNPK